ncbi:MAG: MFS transporter [Mixta calida]|jgi:MFS family permease|uniref:MFS transporter n=1 Tax=Mixta TaxID=2100764 RepID=UPI000535B5C6|nr:MULTISPECIES: MFS transporter [Mixta]AIX75552.1 MFS transporter [Pantoea sp. PSNIH2]MBS6059040.1 MFS transporter [Pantoea sp.]POU50694.1 MFS transporter [Pantoea sp. PSNIH5]POU69246.1 MFS transporter [Pantoea sp. PSNIH4]POY69244.1 MFS transporter [Pantoea sp. PSNIH3]
MPEQPAAETPQSAFRLNQRILSVVVFNFASYLTIGLPLAVLPGYVHDVMGYSAFWAGLVISLQYLSTLLSRPHAGRYADVWGPKKVVVFGLGGCLLSGVCYALAAVSAGWPLVSLALLCIGRLALGIGQSFAGTGSTLWGVGVVGSAHIGRVISWNGICTYGAMALGAPLGALIYHLGGILLLAGVIMLITLVAIVLALPRPAVKGSKGKPLPFRAVLGKIWLFGLLLAMGSAGFGVIATFITLFYQAKGWSGAAFSLTLFSLAFVGARLLFPNSINRHGGLRVALVCFAIEALGLFIVWLSFSPWLANLGALLTGAGFSLVFPALGVVAVKAVPQQNQGSALATFTAFMDLSLGITGPVAGFIMSYAGVPVIYLLSGLLVCLALLLTWRMRDRAMAVE